MLDILYRRYGPSSFLAWIVYSCFYTLISLKKGYYVYYPTKGGYTGKIKLWGGPRFTVFLPSRSAVSFTFACFFRSYYDREKAIPQDCVLLDCGANNGIFSLYAAYKSGSSSQVYAFEPVTKNFDDLSLNISQNHQSTITPVKLGVSDSQQQVDIFLHQESFCHAIVPQSSETDKYIGKETIQLTTIDQYLADNNISPQRVGLVKLDIEGTELKALQGMQSLLTNDHLIILLPDIASYEDDFDGIIDLLRSYNFTIDAMSSGGKIAYK